MIRSFTQNGWEEHHDLFHALKLTGNTPEIICVVGGGGKTTLLCELQKSFKKRGICHALTTTTHMQYRKEESFLEEESLEGFFHVFQQSGTAVIGHPIAERKMKGPSEAYLQVLSKNGVSLLVEADGAKHMPVKIPRPHEPVILHGCRTVILVLGLDALHHPIRDVCFHPELVAAFLEKEEAALLTTDDFVKLAVHYLDGKYEPESYQVVLNKADLCENKKELTMLAQAVGTGLCPTLGHKPVRVHITSLGSVMKSYDHQLEEEE